MSFKVIAAAAEVGPLSSPTGGPTVQLALAAIFLAIALTSMRLLAPIVALVRVLAKTLIVMIMIALTLILVSAAALTLPPIGG